MGAAAQRLSLTHGGAELGREAKVAAAAVRAAHDGDDGGAATRAAENVVRGKELTRNGFAERRAALFECARETVRQRSSPRELLIDLGEIRQGAHGSVHGHRGAALANGSSRRSSAETAWKMASASGASRMVFTAASSANI